MRAIGLDVGDKTIGVAISDPLGLIAQGLQTIRRGELIDDLRSLQQICSEYQVMEIVIGMPKNMNGTVGPQGEKVLAFVEELKKVIELPVYLIDERLSTVAAEKILINADVRRGKRKKVIDKMAAVIILQNYLDRKSAENVLKR